MYTLNMSIHTHTWQKNRLVMCIDLYDKFVYDERLAGLKKGKRMMRDSECKIHLFHSAKRASQEKWRKGKTMKEAIAKAEQPQEDQLGVLYEKHN